MVADREGADCPGTLGVVDARRAERREPRDLWQWGIRRWRPRQCAHRRPL